MVTMVDDHLPVVFSGSCNYVTRFDMVQDTNMIQDLKIPVVIHSPTKTSFDLVKNLGRVSSKNPATWLLSHVGNIL